MGETIKKNESIEKLFKKYFSPFEDILSTRGAVDERVMMAMSFYSEMDYEAAIEKFNAILKDNPGNTSIIFYSGVANLEINKTCEAEECFRKVRESDSEYFSKQSIWYLGLTYLKSYEVEKAIETLKLITPDFKNYNNAKKILDTLVQLEW